jgi:uncharacterized membrane protein YkoI
MSLRTRRGGSTEVVVDAATGQVVSTKVDDTRNGD